MKLLAAAADHRNGDSVSARLRRRRFEILRQLLDKLSNELQRPLRILDVGGTTEYWRTMAPQGNADWQITLLNLYPPAVVEEGFEYIQGDARDLSRYENDAFDIVVSNSVIEHVGTYADQQAMAAEVRRVARCYYLQTPNRYFPIEPHFLTPGFQFLPEWAQIWMVRHFRLGTYDVVPDREQAKALVREIRLLGRGEFTALFPDAEIHTERFYGLAKSFTAVGGKA